MAAIDHEKDFDGIIEARLRSEEWNLIIARKMLARRRKTRYKFIAAGLVASLGCALFITGTFPFLSLPLPSEGEELSNFIQAQVDGTWKRNAGGTIRIDKKDILIVGAQFEARLDEMIEEALYERF